MDCNWFKGLHSVTILRHPIPGWYCANYSPIEFKQRLHHGWDGRQQIWCFNRQLLSNFHVSWLLLKEISRCQEPGLAGTESNWWMKAIPTSQCRVLDIEIDCPVERSVSVLYLNLKASASWLSTRANLIKSDFICHTPVLSLLTSYWSMAWWHSPLIGCILGDNCDTFLLSDWSAAAETGDKRHQCSLLIGRAHIGMLDHWTVLKIIIKRC